MRCKRLLSFLCVLAVFIGCFAIDASAVESQGKIIMRALGRFSTEVPAKSLYAADSSFTLENGDTISIQASYSPQDVNVKVGVIAPNGRFYAVDSGEGIVDGSLTVNQTGDYTLAIRNSSFEAVSVTGFIRY